MPDDGKTFHIQFPSNIMLEVRLENPHPVHMRVRFSDNSSVEFSYEPDSADTHKGTAVYHGTKRDHPGPFTSARPDIDPSFDTKLGPATAPAGGVVGASGGDVFILYNDPGGSRM